MESIVKSNGTSFNLEGFKDFTEDQFRAYCKKLPDVDVDGIWLKIAEYNKANGNTKSNPAIGNEGEKGRGSKKVDESSVRKSELPKTDN